MVFFIPARKYHLPVLLRKPVHDFFDENEKMNILSVFLVLAADYAEFCAPERALS
jgi:hypothetical protein